MDVQRAVEKRGKLRDGEKRRERPRRKKEKGEERRDMALLGEPLRRGTRWRWRCILQGAEASLQSGSRAGSRGTRERESRAKKPSHSRLLSSFLSLFLSLSPPPSLSLSLYRQPPLQRNATAKCEENVSAAASICSPLLSPPQPRPLVTCVLVADDVALPVRRLECHELKAVA